MNSIRGRLTLSLVATILPLIAISDVFLYVYIANSLRGQFDANLLTKAQTFTRMAEWEDEIEEEDDDYEDFGDDSEDLLRFEFAELALPEFQPSADSAYYQVRDRAGRTYARSPSMTALRSDLPVHAASTASGALIADITLPDARLGRMATLAFVPEGGDSPLVPADAPGEVLLNVALSTEGLSQTLASVRASMLVAATATIAIAGLLLWTAGRRGLRPLEELGDRLRRTTTDTLAEPFNPSGQPAELVPVYSRVNELLERIGAALERERRFTSDVAHELRTPIAELRTLAEVSGTRPGLSEVDRNSYRDSLDIAIRMQRLVTTLLELARWDSGELGKDLKRADLAKLINAAWQPLMETASEKKLTVSLALDDHVEIDTDPVILGMIFANLLSNAVDYTPPGGDITLECDRSRDHISVTLSNTTHDLTPRDVPNLFQKFWRKDRSRETDTHFGLGLALVAALARALGVTVEGRVPANGVFEVSIVHPC